MPFPQPSGLIIPVCDHHVVVSGIDDVCFLNRVRLPSHADGSHAMGALKNLERAQWQRCWIPWILSWFLDTEVGLATVEDGLLYPFHPATVSYIHNESC
jgi:hypothetical protein